MGSCVNHVPPPVQVHQWGEPGGQGDWDDPASLHPSQGGEGGQPGQPRDAAHVLLLAFRVPARTLSPPQGDEAKPAGETRFHLCPSSHGELQQEERDLGSSRGGRLCRCLLRRPPAPPRRAPPPREPPPPSPVTKSCQLFAKRMPLSVRISCATPCIFSRYMFTNTSIN